MNYSFDYLNRAVAKIAAEKKARDAAYGRQLNELYRAVPELTEIENSLSKFGIAAATAAVSGQAEKIGELAATAQSLREKQQEILDAAGIKEPKTECSLCGDTGLLENGKYCECAYKRACGIQLEELSEISPIDECTFESFNLKYYPTEGTPSPRKVLTKILKMAKEYAIGFSRQSGSILFIGGVGLGKTHLTLAMVREIIAKGYNVVYGSSQNIFNDIEKEHFSYSGETKVTDALLNCDLLVIDDLGTEFSTSFTQSAFYNIVNTRLLKRLPTIINTNLSLKEIEQRYTPRIASRFFGNYEMIQFLGNDIRLQKMMNK